MYGVPVKLDLKWLHGAELIQVCLGVHQIQFHLHPKGSIFVENGWELLDPRGECIDRNFGNSERPPYQLRRLLARRVINSEVSAPRRFALRFESGEVLRIFDDSEKYESFEIQPGGIIV
jgi:hypothetical protein